MLLVLIGITNTSGISTSPPVGLQIMDKYNETNDKFYRKVAFLMYTETVNFRPQS